VNKTWVHRRADVGEVGRETLCYIAEMIYTTSLRFPTTGLEVAALDLDRSSRCGETTSSRWYGAPSGLLGEVTSSDSHRPARAQIS